MVEVHGGLDNSTVEQLFPAFLERVALLGGNGAYIESMRASFPIATRPYAESYLYGCGFRTCVGTRYNAMVEERTRVSIRGRAYLVPGIAGAPAAPSTPVTPQANAGGTP